jgi:hypothetical protein
MSFERVERAAEGSHYSARCAAAHSLGLRLDSLGVHHCWPAELAGRLVSGVVDCLSCCCVDMRLSGYGERR